MSDGWEASQGGLSVVAKREDLLRRLCESSGHKRDLIDDLDQSRSTVDRGVEALAAAGLVERSDDGIRATSAGRLALEWFERFRRGMDDIESAGDVLAPLSADAPIDTDAVAGSEALLAAEPAPYRPLERFHGDLADAERYRAVLPAMDDPRHVRLLYEHVVTEGNPAELVVSDELLRTLRAEFPRRTDAMADADGFRLLEGETPPFALCLLDDDAGTTVYVLVFSESGGVHGALVNSDDAAVRWAEARFDAATADAEVRSDALAADPDGGGLNLDGGVARAAIGRSLPVPLEREGFVRLDVPYFRDEPVADPPTAWRTGLTIPEVHTGYAVERTPGDWSQAAAADADGDSMADALLDRLEAGENCVVLGPPGSGKSTTCKRVACEWYDRDLGPVLYRPGGRGRPFESVDDLVVTVEVPTEHALVVVEDAVRADADAVFDAVDRLGDRDDVSFLLDARHHEWRDPPGDPGDVTDLETLSMPGLDDGDGQRLIEHVEETVGEPVDVPLDRLREEVRAEATTDDEATPDELLLLLHRVATYVDPLAEGGTSLEAAVARLSDDLAGDELALDVCTLVNALNAAGVEFEPAYGYAVADSDGYDAVDEALKRLEGRVLFPREDGTYRTVHESWSVAFLAHLLDADGEEQAAERFGRCVTALLSLADDTERRSDVRARLDRRTGVLDDPATWADEIAEELYALGRERPKLAPLFGDGSDDAIDLPDACPEATAGERPVWLGRTFLAGGLYDRAERAFRRLPEADTDRAVERLLGLARVGKERGDYESTVANAEECLELLDGLDRPTTEARANRLLGAAKVHLGDNEAAEAALRAALDGFTDADDARGRASTLRALGVLADRRGNPETAREHHQESLDLLRELGDRVGEAKALFDLGEAARSEGDLGEAGEYHQRSLELARAVGDRQGESRALNTLGVLAAQQENVDRAREHFERGLELARRIGDRQGVADMLGNLGNLADVENDHERAREYFERALEISRELGDRRGEARTLLSLGDAARQQGDHESAREYHERSLDVARDIEDPDTEAINLQHLARMASIEGDYGRAKRLHERNLEIASETGDRRGQAVALNNLGDQAFRRGRYDEARERFERSLEIREELGGVSGRVNVHNNLGTLDFRRGEYERAADHHRRALELAEELGDADGMATGRRGLAEVARRQGRLDEARTHLQRGREALDEPDDRYEPARLDLARGRVELAAGDVEAAAERATAALDAFEAMDATHWTARCRCLLGRIAAVDGDHERARERLTAAVAAFEDVGCPQDAFRALEHLVDVAGRLDDGDPDRWCRRARELLDEAPDPVAERHRGWVRRACSGTDAG